MTQTEQVLLTIIVVSITALAGMMLYEGPTGPGRPNDTWWPKVGGVLVTTVFVAFASFLIALIW